LKHISPSTFAELLLEMGELSQRNLPWKNTLDPYHIWISEIILQQTRVAQGLDYYIRFVTKFPTISVLARAPIDDVLKAWEGLGYYSRARNLHAASHQIMDNYGGVFPSEYEHIKSLKGIGPYTASAIASFAFGQPYASLDGNAHRLFSRVLAIDDVVGSRSFDEKVVDFAQKAIANVDPSKFNQAVMDIGAQICTPSSPKCGVCLFADHCLALRRDMVEQLPIKKPKAPVKHRYFHYFLLTYRDELMMELRTANDIWKGLYQLPVIESTSDQLPENQKLFDLDISTSLESIWSGSQLLSHQRIHARVYAIKLQRRPKINKDQYLVERQKVLNFAFPKVINSFFENKIELLISKRQKT
jgi:A/G-specific adenine glycosylase